MNSLTKLLEEWNTNTDSRQKLQHAYVATACALVLIAGIIGLVNYELGQRILLAAILAIGLFFVNAVAWALLQSFVLLKLGANKAVEKLAPTAIKSTASSRKKK